MYANKSDILKRLAIFDDRPGTTDFTIVHGARKWPVHRLILALHSSVFEKACYGEFKEAKDAKIDLTSEPESIVAALVHYLYHTDYDAPLSHSTQSEENPDTKMSNNAHDDNQYQPGAFSFHAQMALLGDCYGMKHLKSIACNKFESLLHGRKKPQKKDLVEDLIAAARIVYQARRAMAMVCKPLVHYLTVNDWLFKRDPQGNSSAEQLLESVPALATDYSRALRASLESAGQALAESAYRCPECRATFFMTINDPTQLYECEKCGEHEMCGTAWEGRAVSSKRSLPTTYYGSWWVEE